MTNPSVSQGTVRNLPARRIVIFAPHYAEYAIRLAQALGERAEVLLFVDRVNRRNECDGVRPTPSAGLRVVEFGSIGRIRRLVACATILAHLLHFRPTLINVQEEEGRFTALVTRLLRGFAPILLTVHDPTPHSGSDSDYLAANRANLASTRASAAAFHVHGRFCREALVSVVGEGRPILETAHGVLLVPEPGERRAPEPGRILMFGRMEAYKGLDTLLDAAATLQARGIAFRLVLAGRGPEIDRLSERIAAAPYLESLNRFVPAHDVREQFQRALCSVCPYLNATQSGVIAAAFGNGRPVVASKVGGLADAVIDGQDGILVPPGDAEGLADALATVLSEGETWTRLAAGARRAAETTFAWSSIAASLLAFVEDKGLGTRR